MFQKSRFLRTLIAFAIIVGMFVMPKLAQVAFAGVPNIAQFCAGSAPWVSTTQAEADALPATDPCSPAGGPYLTTGAPSINGVMWGNWTEARAASIAAGGSSIWRIHWEATATPATSTPVPTSTATNTSTSTPTPTHTATVTPTLVGPSLGTCDGSVPWVSTSAAQANMLPMMDPCSPAGQYLTKGAPSINEVTWGTWTEARAASIAAGGSSIWKIVATATPTATPSSTPTPTATPSSTPTATVTPTPTPTAIYVCYVFEGGGGHQTCLYRTHLPLVAKNP